MYMYGDSSALGADPDNRQILKELTAVEGKMAEARKNRFRRMAVEEVDGDDDSGSTVPSVAPKVFKKIVVEELQRKASRPSVLEANKQFMDMTCHNGSTKHAPLEGLDITRGTFTSNPDSNSV